MRSLFGHYIDYLSSSGGLTALLLALFCLYILRSVALEKNKSLEEVPRCVRLCLQGESNISDQFEKLEKNTQEKPRVKAIFVYPIKSCRGIELSTCGVLKTGLAYDRLFTFAQGFPKTEQGNKDELGDRQWRFITQREYPKLALLETELWIPDPRLVESMREDSILPAVEKVRGRREIVDDVEDWSANGGCLIVRFPHESAGLFGLKTETITIKLPLSPTPKRAKMKQYSSEKLEVGRDCPLAINMTTEISPSTLAKLQTFCCWNAS